MRHRRSVLAIAACLWSLAACVQAPTGAGTADPTTPSLTEAPAATPKPTPRPTATPTPTPTATPRPTRAALTVPPGPSAMTIEGGDPASAAAVIDAVDRLAGLRAYRFELSTVGRTLLQLDSDQYLDITVQGSLTNAPSSAFDILASTRMLESAFDGATSFSSRLVVIENRAWGIQPGQDPAQIEVTDEALEFLAAAYLPDGVATRAITPFADAFVRVGPERRAGIDAIHYRATKAGLKAYASVIEMQGKWSADLWIAQDGRYLVAVEIDCTPKPLPTPDPDASPGLGGGTWAHDRGFHVRLEVRDANDSTIEVTPPS